MQQWFAELIKIEFGLPHVDIVNGSTPISRRKEITDHFQRHLEKDQGFDVLVMGPRAAGTGLTLTAANHVIHLTRWWNPAVEEQCNDRTHRIGQKHPVTVHIPLAIHPRLHRGSFDCLLQSLMKRKRSLADSVLWPPESDENEVKALYDAILGAEEVEAETKAFEDLRLFDYPDLSVQEIDTNTIRVRPSKGGASVLVSTDASQVCQASIAKGDAVAILLSEVTEFPITQNVPLSVLGSAKLWPDFILPE